MWYFKLKSLYYELMKFCGSPCAEEIVSAVLLKSLRFLVDTYINLYPSRVQTRQLRVSNFLCDSFNSVILYIS